jgi:hypothetical protein
VFLAFNRRVAGKMPAALFFATGTNYNIRGITYLIQGENATLFFLAAGELI